MNETVGVLNKFSLALTALVDRKVSHVAALHVTSDFTEVTNGRYALRISNVQIDPDEYPNGPNKETIYEGKIDVVLPADIAAKIQSNLPVKVSLPILKNAIPGVNTGGNNVEFITYDLQVWGPIRYKTDPDERVYPNIDAVIPTDVPMLIVGLDPDYLIRLMQQFKKNGVTLAKFEFYGVEKVIKITGKNPDTEQELTALLMPQTLK